MLVSHVTLDHFVRVPVTANCREVDQPQGTGAAWNSMENSVFKCGAPNTIRWLRNWIKKSILILSIKWVTQAHQDPKLRLHLFPCSMCGSPHFPCLFASKQLYNSYPPLREVYKIIQVRSTFSQHFKHKVVDIKISNKWIPWVRSKSTATGNSLKPQPSTPIKGKASATKALQWEYLNKTIYLAPYNSENQKHHGKARGCSLILTYF